MFSKSHNTEIRKPNWITRIPEIRTLSLYLLGSSASGHHWLYHHLPSRKSDWFKRASLQDGFLWSFRVNPKIIPQKRIHCCIRTPKQLLVKICRPKSRDSPFLVPSFYSTSSKMGFDGVSESCRKQSVSPSTRKGPICVLGLRYSLPSCFVLRKIIIFITKKMEFWWSLRVGPKTVS